MGEKAVHPKETNGVSNGHDHTDEEMAEEEDFDDMTAEGTKRNHLTQRHPPNTLIPEFNAINNQLDALNSALDDIEQKNDDIHAQLLQLLEANREVRKQIQETNQSGENSQQSGSQGNEGQQ